MNIDEVSDNEKSKICLYAGLQNLLEKSVEEIKINRMQRKNKRKMGFQEILNIDDCYVQRIFAQWLGDNNVPEEVMKFGSKTIPINPRAFVDVLGLPAGDLQVLTDEECGKEAFLAFWVCRKFQQSSISVTR